MFQDDEIDRAVFRYLETHPSAADTLEGITDWWLERRRVVVAVDIVTTALERLIRQGLVEKLCRPECTPSLPPLFRIANLSSSPE